MWALHTNPSETLQRTRVHALEQDGRLRVPTAPSVFHGVGLHGAGRGRVSVMRLSTSG